MYRNLILNVVTKKCSDAGKTFCSLKTICIFSLIIIIILIIEITNLLQSPAIYVTGFAKTIPSCTIAEFHFYSHIDRQVCFYRQLVADPVKPSVKSHDRACGSTGGH